MDISKFNFMNFGNEKWQEILTEIEGDYNYVEKVTPNYKNENGLLIPSVKMEYVYETQADGFDTYFLTFTAFDVKVESEVLEIATRVWRKIMYKEFGKTYYEALKEYLKFIKETKIQKADEDYLEALEDLTNI